MNCQKKKKKINKQLIVNFYQILIENVPLFPNLDAKKEAKANLIQHLQKFFLAFQEHYFNALNYI